MCKRLFFSLMLMFAVPQGMSAASSQESGAQQKVGMITNNNGLGSQGYLTTLQNMCSSLCTRYKDYKEYLSVCMVVLSAYAVYKLGNMVKKANIDDDFDTDEEVGSEGEVVTEAHCQQ